MLYLLTVSLDLLCNFYNCYFHSQQNYKLKVIYDSNSAVALSDHLWSCLSLGLYFCAAEMFQNGSGISSCPWGHLTDTKEPLSLSAVWSLFTQDLCSSLLAPLTHNMSTFMYLDLLHSHVPPSLLRTAVQPFFLYTNQVGAAARTLLWDPLQTCFSQMEAGY